VAVLPCRDIVALMMTLEAATAVLLAIVSALAPQNAAPASVVREDLRQPMKFVDLTYPSEALAARVRGFVVIELVLDDQGRVTSTDVLTGAPLLAAPAAANAKEWVFGPQSAGRTAPSSLFSGRGGESVFPNHVGF
jgi:TonB family protein